MNLEMYLIGGVIYIDRLFLVISIMVLKISFSLPCCSRPITLYISSLCVKLHSRSFAKKLDLVSKSLDVWTEKKGVRYVFFYITM